MSMFQVFNATQADIVEFGYTFAPGIVVDLLETSGLRLTIDDILGIHGGDNYQTLSDRIRSGDFTFTDGDGYFQTDCALHLLKYGTLPEIKVKQVPSGLSGWATRSHNIADMDEWTEGESKFVVEPTAGKKLHLTGTKVLVCPNFVASNDMYFRVYMDVQGYGNIVVREDLYTNMNQLKAGAENIFVSPPIANGSDRGSPELVHIKYVYTEVITLDSALNMRLEIGIKDNTPLTTKSHLWVRIEGKSETVS